MTGDKYAGEWIATAYRKRGVIYRYSDRSKSEIYVDALPMFTAQGVDLLDLPRLTHQLVTLERRALRSGRETVDHAPGAIDDLANAVCGALVYARSIQSRRGGQVTVMGLY